MENEMDDLKAIWKSAKDHAKQPARSIEELIRQAELKKKRTLVSHYGNIIVLSSVVFMLIGCFYFFFPFRDVLSRAGIGFMVGGLIIRIGIEVFSAMKSNEVNVVDTTTKATEDTIAFYQFRKKIHGPVTLTIVLLYMAGFYMLTPEFSLYLPFSTLMMVDISFLFVVVGLAWVIGIGIRKELKDLKGMVEIRKQLL